MCCRYGYEPGIIEDVEWLSERIFPGVDKIRAGDVSPSDPGVILRSDPETPGICADVMPWGFFSFDKKLLINARAESVLEKKLFSEGIRHRRCVIPAGCFYEWDRNKVKNTFTLPEERALFMAGFYDLFENQDRFIILTTEANESMRPVHDRMPLLFSKDRIRDWILDDSSVKDLLSEMPPLLDRKPEYEQLTLF